MDVKNIGYIGLGNMGAPMVMNLIAGGYQVHSIQNRSPIPKELINKGIIVETNLKSLAQKCQVVFTNLPDAPDVRQVIFGGAGKEGLIAGLAGGSIIIDNSTTAPEEAVAIAQKLVVSQVDFVDAPVSGGVVGAKAGTLSIMVGANEAIFNQIQPFLEKIGKTITRIGETGAGQICKACNQIAIAGALGAVAEALVFAQKNKVDMKTVRNVLLGGAASSKTLEFQGGRMVERDFSPKFSNKLYHKDLQIVLNNAKTNGISLPTTALIFQLINAQKAQGMEDLDAAVIIKIIEQLSGINTA